MPQSSVSVHVLVIITAHGSVLSVTSTYVAFNPTEQLSDSSVTSPVNAKSVASSSQLIVSAEGAVKVGNVTSSTMIVCITSIEFPQSSVTL